MTTNITPDKARALLDTARQEAGDGQRPVTVAAQYAPLAEAAYALAELVANMHYEYAVEVRSVLGDYWERVTRWEPDPQLLFPKGKALVDSARIVRRLVSDPEVVE